MLPLILTLALVGTPLVAASVQTPELISCSDAEDIQVRDVTITDAQIGKTMVVNFTLDIKKPLGSDPTLKPSETRASPQDMLQVLWGCGQTMDATDVQMSDLTITDAIIRKTVSVNFTLTINKELGEDPKVIVSLRRKDGSEIGCIEGIGSCTYKLCKGSTGKDRNVKSVSDAKCPIAATKIQKSMRAPLGFMIQFAIGWALKIFSAQFKVITDSQIFRLSNVTIKDATISKTMTVRFTVTLTEALGDNPKLHLILRKKSGIKIPCLLGYGSCVYKLCGGTSNAEKFLGQLWNNECPVPARERQESASARLDPMIQLVIGRAPTTLTVEYKVKNGGSTVGCQSFDVRVDAA
ncbi:hypothetical protein HPB49_018352 [Dermacentor silvarum]|uniref:Uncharacterized protein n=1 Tax=Dermacentor silvarum TaxID=543639 RepID=A0ACB8C4X0_DERSI|nr:hypothetical protein HPB49_018352 [Dermacentor silvarum]